MNLVTVTGKVYKLTVIFIFAILRDMCDIYGTVCVYNLLFLLSFSATVASDHDNYWVMLESEKIIYSGFSGRSILSSLLFPIISTSRLQVDSIFLVIPISFMIHTQYIY